MNLRWLILLLLASHWCVQGAVRYVKPVASGNGDGSNWANASGDLQAMITASVAGDSVYVAAGTYYARRGSIASDGTGVSTQYIDRYRAFVLKAGVSVYGGFPANATAAMTPETRPRSAGAKYGWQLSTPSVLTGAVPPELSHLPDNWNLDGTNQRWIPDGYLQDNALHVVWFASGTFYPGASGTPARAGALTAATVLDGFTVEGGSADGVVSGSGNAAGTIRHGGGVYLVENGEIRNCIVRKNYASSAGGGVFLNYGGLVSDCFIGSNASPGIDDNLHGSGGGVYILGKGTVDRSFVVNNSARIGGGIYIDRDWATNTPYEAEIQSSIITNNSALHEAGGIYANRAGVLTASYVLYNHTQSLAIQEYGHTGGILCDEYLVMTNTALYGNTALSNTCQFYAVNTIGATETEIASLQVFYSAVWLKSSAMFGLGTVTEVIDLATGNNIDPYRSAGFKEDPGVSGIRSLYLQSSDYLAQTDWDKEDYSAFIRAGATELEAPWLVRTTPGLKPEIPVRTIDGTEITARPGIGPYYAANVTVNFTTEGGVRYVFVDNTSPTPGDGSSWDQPLRFIGPAVDRLSATGGGTVCIKQGEYQPLRSSAGGTPQEYFLEMKAGVTVQGGYPPDLTGTDRSGRNPVEYRTILSGDVGVRGELSDNLYHLVEFDVGATGTSTLDGLNLMYANAEGDVQRAGGAIRVVSGANVYIQNCLIENNRAETGAAVYYAPGQWNTVLRMENCVINNNESTAGYAVDVGATTLVNVTIVMNQGNGIRGTHNTSLSRSVVWGNSGAAQTSELSSTAYCAIQGGLLPNTVDAETAETYFVNPTLTPGVMLQGYGTLDGESALFRPQCNAPFVGMTAWDQGLPTDITVETNRTNGGAGVTDCGAYQSVCGSNSGSGRIWYVKTNGNGTGNSWDNAMSFPSLMQSIQNVQAGDQIWVAAGTHTVWGNNFVMPKGVKVYGGFPANAAVGTGMAQRDPWTHQTILNKPGWENKRVLEQLVESLESEAVWDGFVISGGNVGGASLKRGGRLVNCVITGNTLTAGSGNNYTGTNSGAGVYNNGGILENCFITDNIQGMASGRGAGLYMVSGSVYNTVIARNSASGASSEGAAVAVGGATAAGTGTAELFNVTIAGNTGASDVYVAFNSVLSVTNSILIRGTNTPAAPVINNLGNFVPIYSCLFGQPGGTGNISLNPQLEGGNSYQLAAGSPCINTGGLYPFGTYLPPTDLAGTSRINNCAMDMGAYEYGDGGGNVLAPAVIGDTARLYVTYYGSGLSDGSSWTNALCADLLQLAINYLSTNSNQPVRQVWVGRGTDYPAIEAVFYPTEKADPLLSDRFKTFTIRPGVDLLGHFAGDEQYAAQRALGDNRIGVTVLDGNIGGTVAVKDDVYRVVTFDPGVAAHPATLDNFLIRNGNANCTWEDALKVGGGVLVQPGGVVSNCYIYNCRAALEGGGVYLIGADGSAGFPDDVQIPPVVARLNGSVVERCEAATGGGVYAGPYAIVTGNTIVLNKADRGGGIAFFNPPPLIQSTVLWRNEAAVRRNIAGMTDIPFGHVIPHVLPFPYYPVNYSAVEGEQLAGLSNLSISSDNNAAEDSPGFLDPEFANLRNNGWALGSNSSLIDRGMHSGIGGIDTPEKLLHWYLLSPRDIAGGERFKNIYGTGTAAMMDIGAYEEQEAVELQPDAHSRLYVTRVGRGTKNGSSWANATPDLQAALNWFREAETEGEVWVQGGTTYLPIRQIDETTVDEREVSFVLNPYVKLYGGFKGDPYPNPDDPSVLSETDPAQRRLFDYDGNGVQEQYGFQYATILDGAINPNDVSGSAYHVLYYAPEETPGDTIVLNGLTVKNGRARTIAQPDAERKRYGGGLYATAPVRVEACTFAYNEAEGDGGAICLQGGGTVIGSTVERNFSEIGNGGGIFIQGGQIIQVNVSNNTALDGTGGGVAAVESELLNVTVVRNEAAEAGGVYIEETEVANTVVWGNAQSAGGGMEISGFGTVSFSALPETGVPETILTDEASVVWLPAGNNLPGGPRFLRPATYPGVGGYSWMSNWETEPGSALMDRGNSETWTEQGLPSGLFFLIEDPTTGVWSSVDRIQGAAIDIGTYERIPVQVNTQCDTLYVRTWENPNEACDGSTWAKATTNLEEAIRVLSLPGRTGNREIWMAQGEYAPEQRRDPADPASRSFVLTENGIKIYGGFPDVHLPTFSPDKGQRNPVQYKTVWNGADAGSASVVFLPDNAGTGEWLLDGIEIRGGRSAGIYAGESSGKLVLNRCLFTANGGAPDANSAAVFASRPVESYNCLFFQNSTAALNAGTAVVVNNTVVQNTGGGIWLRDPDNGNQILNTVLWGNGDFQLQVPDPAVATYCAVMGAAVGTAAQHNLSLPAGNYEAGAPRFRNYADNSGAGYKPGCNSILIDGGSNEALALFPDNPNTQDLLNGNRVLTGAIDIGAFESDLTGTVLPAPVISPAVVDPVCQNATVTLSVDELANYQVLWFRDGNIVGTASSLQVVASEVKTATYYALYEEDISNGCRSDMSQGVDVTVSPTSAVTDLSAPAIFCTGGSDPLTLTFTPMEGYTYELFRDGTSVQAGIVSGTVSLTGAQPTGQHEYHLVSTGQQGGTACTGQSSNSVWVEVQPWLLQNPEELLWMVAESGATDQEVCKGSSLVPIRFEYAPGTAVLNPSLPGGISFTRGAHGSNTVTIEGIPGRAFNYTIHTQGNTCSSAHLSGTVSLLPVPVFKLGE